MQPVRAVAVPGGLTAKTPLEVLSVRLLGPVAVQTASGIRHLRSPKHQTLLTMLALSPGRVVSSDALTMALWGDDPPDTAETALRVHVARLRESLATATSPAPAIVARASGYALEMEADRVDSVLFATLVSQLAGGGTAALERVERALAMWRGAPFSGASSPDVVHFEAERLTELYEAAQEDRCEILLGLGKHQQAVAEAEALVRAQSLRERRSLLLMKALYRCGRQADALAAYRNLRAVLERELGLDPSPELQSAEHAILAQDAAELERLGSTIAPTGPGPSQETLPWWLGRALSATMVGRDELVGDAVARVRGICEAHTDLSMVPVILLRGEAGVGKSRLLAEVAARVRSELGVRVCAGWCDPEAVIPFRPIMEVFRNLGDQFPGPLPASMQSAVEYVRSRLTAGAEGRTDPETDRLRFFESVAALLLEASAQSPILLVIDDIQWLDSSSAALLRHLLRQSSPQPVVLAACFRTDPNEHSRAWSHVLDELARENAGQLLELDELSPDAAERLVELLLNELGGSDAADATVIERVIRLTGGNPLFIREIVPQLARSQYVIESGSVPMPPSILASVSGRLASMSGSARDTLNAAAVLGLEFTLKRLADVMGQNPERVLAPLDEAMTARVIDEVPGRLDRFMFHHAVFREAVHELMPRSRQVRLHLAAGQSFGMDSEADSTLSRAFHLLAAVPACPPQVAASAAIEAADAAVQRLAFESAIGLLEQAVTIADADPSITETTLFELLIRLGRARAYRGEDDASAVEFGRAADVARRTGDASRLAVAALGDDLDTRPFTPAPEKLTLMSEALAEIGDEESDLRVRLASAYVMLESLHAGPRKVRRLADDTLELARRLGDPLSLSKAELAWLSCRRLTVAPQERLAVATDSLNLAAGQGHTSRAARARLLRIGVLVQLGLMSDARAELARYRDEAESTRVPRHLWHSEVVAAALEVLSGRFADAQAYADRALQLAEANGIPEARMAYAIHVFCVSWHQGHLGMLRRQLDAFAAARPDLGLWRLSAALAASASGDSRVAFSHLDGFLGRIPDLDPDGEFAANELMQAAQLTFELRAGSIAASMLEKALTPCRSQFGILGATSGTLGPVDRLLGLLAWVQGDHDKALGLLRLALEECRAMDALPWMVWSGTDLVELLRKVGRNREAQTLTTSLLPVATRLAMTVHERRLVA